MRNVLGLNRFEVVRVSSGQTGSSRMLEDG